jgi:tetratricopeptide (TPR) repeat protein
MIRARALVLSFSLCLSSFGASVARAQDAPAAPAAATPAADVGALVAQAKDAVAAKKWTDAKKASEEALKTDANNVEANAYLGLAGKGLGKCKAAVKPLDKAFAGKPAVPGVARALAECLGDKAKDKTKLGRAWLAAAREDKDGVAALKAGKLLAGNPKTSSQAYAAFELADAQGKLGDDDLAAYAAAAEAEKKLPEAKKLTERALEKKVGDRALTLSLARVLIAANDLPGAETRVGEVLAKTPDDADALVLKADIAGAKGDAATEEQTLRAALGKQEKNETLRKRLAGVLGKQARAKIDAGDAKGAQEKAEEALKLDAKSGRAQDALGRAQWAQGDKAKAEKNLKALAEQPDSEVSGEGVRLSAELALDSASKNEKKDKNALANARKLADRAGKLGAKNIGYTRARLAQADGDLAAAEKAIAAHLVANPTDGEGARLGGDIAYDAGKAKVARERYEKADQLGALNAKGQGRLCEARVRDGAFDGAKDACGKALAGGNEEAAVHANLGLAMYRLGDKAGAKKEIAAASSKGAKDKSTLLVQGLLAESDGNEAEALAFYDKVLAADANNVEANAQSGKLLEKRGKHAEAVKRLGKAHKADPSNAKLSVSLAKAQLGAGKLGDAQRTMRTIPNGALDEATQRTLNGQVEAARGNYKKANEEFEKALAAKPGDPEVLALQGQNYLKLPHYDKAIERLEAAQKADPSRADVTEQLARLYAETGQADKAAQAVGKLDAIQKSEAEQQRKAIEPKEQKRIAIDENFKSLAKDGDESADALGLGLRKLVASDLQRSPYVVIIDRSKEGEEALRKERDAQLSAANRETAAAAEAGKELAPQYVLTGTYQVAADGGLSVFLKLIDIKTKAAKGGTGTGNKDKITDVERHAVAELLDAMGLLTDQERVALERATGGPNYESFVKMTEGDAAKARGDLRGALKLYGEAKDADQGNPRALVGYAEALKDVGEKNRIAIPQPTSSGNPPEGMVVGLRAMLSSKLANVQGIHVIEREKVDAILKERDYQGAAENRENIDPASLPKEEAKELAARVLLQTRVDYAPAGVSLSASLIDMDDNKLILGDQVSGKESEIQQLQNTLAVNIVRKLRGEPTDDEMKALQKIQADDEYKKQMAELARLQASEKDRLAKDAAAKGVTVAELAKEEVKKKEADKAKEPPPVVATAPDVVVTKATGTTSSDDWEPTFEVGLRSAILAKDQAGDHHASKGLMFTWMAYATRHHRVALLLDLESTRLTSGRSDASNRNQTGFYGVGVDWTMPIAFHGTGLFLGVEGTYGVLQSSTATSPVTTDWVLQLMPHAGAGLAWRGVGLFADAGYRVQLFRNDASKSASVGGLVLQGGVRVDMSEGSERDKTWDLGYTARAYAPNGSAVYGRYGGLPFTSGGGPLLGHELSVVGGGGGSHFGQGVAFIYMGADGTSGAAALKVYELSYVGTFHAFTTEQFFNPYLGFRLGFNVIKGDEAILGKASSTGLVGAATAGVDFNFGQTFTLRAGFAYDGVYTDTKDDSNGSLSGYAVEAGAIFRL